MEHRIETEQGRLGLGLRRLGVYTALLVLLFAGSLLELARLSLRDDLVSHTLLVPLISGYLVWMRLRQLPAIIGGARWPGVLFGLAGLLVLASSRTDLAASSLAPMERLSAQILSFCLLLWGGGFLFVGGRLVRALAFPGLFLFFMIPLPAGVIEGLEGGLQHASAETAFRFIRLTGTPVFREGVVFQMPGIAIEVSRECSGIRSTLVLFITALLAGHMFLRSAWTRILLAVLVIPLGIVRNAFRVLVISMLTVHVDPSYLHSPIHRQGGPLFFVLSLIPFSLILLWLRRIERKRGGTSVPGGEAAGA